MILARQAWGLEGKRCLKEDSDNCKTSSWPRDRCVHASDGQTFAPEHLILSARHLAKGGSRPLTGCAKEREREREHSTGPLSLSAQITRVIRRCTPEASAESLNTRGSGTPALEFASGSPETNTAPGEHCLSLPRGHRGSSLSVPLAPSSRLSSALDPGKKK